MRRRRAEKRKIAPDRKFADLWSAKFIRKIMIGGKINTAERIYYGACLRAVNIINGTEAVEDPAKVMEMLAKIRTNVEPKRKVVARRFGGTTYSVPKEIDPERRPLEVISIIVKKMRNLAADPKRKAGKSSEDILTNLFVQSYNGTGPAVEEKESLQKTADANETFSHFLR